MRANVKSAFIGLIRLYYCSGGNFNFRYFLFTFRTFSDCAHDSSFKLKVFRYNASFTGCRNAQRVGNPCANYGSKISVMRLLNVVLDRVLLRENGSVFTAQIEVTHFYKAAQVYDSIVVIRQQLIGDNWAFRVRKSRSKSFCCSAGFR